ncbi:response regulator transcription factor [Streptomyces sp. P9(2023)]|uniref:response regulator transcription factor n=1 Tax=Streptomyces sp. P9(2023) TaxID=3064394 RepID=UPI0028F42AFA|nr:response regulator transcription factor [Streptomyces sp. P9(2023)]MDT9691495.1 response regulator transcription factor [Streptomyces sp. P9(2023)]
MVVDRARTRRLPAAWRLLVVENADDEAAALVTGLRRHGHHVDRVATGAAALDAFAGADLVLLDLELPDLDGLEVCRRIRAAGRTAVIAVTARGTELDLVLGLRAGADDCLVKPYGFRELMARMEAVLRRVRAYGDSPRVIGHGPLLIDAEDRHVTLRGRRIDLTPKEFDLLLLLALTPGTVVPRWRVLQSVCRDGSSPRTLDAHIGGLRRKLGDGAWVLTVQGVGLQLGSA